VEKRIAAFDARRNFGKVLQDVSAKGDRFLIERHGEPVAALVSIELYNQWRRTRDDFFAGIRAAQARADLSPAADDLAEEAVRAVRAQL
jgi:prevent-host-death family protein